MQDPLPADEMTEKRANPRAAVDGHPVKRSRSSSGSTLCSWRVLLLCFQTKAAATGTEKQQRQEQGCKATRQRRRQERGPHSLQGRSDEVSDNHKPSGSLRTTTTPPAPSERNGKFIFVPQASFFSQRNKSWTHSLGGLQTWVLMF